MQNTALIKDQIINLIQRRGPSLPVHISNEIKQSMLFSSAFLSELLSEKRIKISNMKVGGSPLYFLSGQEPQLEKHAHHLKSREKDAFELLKRSKFLRDKNQEPAIRVALRSIRDFAIPFKKNEEIFWRFFIFPISEFRMPSPPTTSKKPQKEAITPPAKKLEIFDKPKKKEIKKTTKKKTTISQKKNEKFFNKVKEYLTQEKIEIIDILGFNKTDLILKVNEKDKEKLLITYNKKRITEADIIKAHKKAQEYNLPYIIFSLGEPTKKLTNFIQAIKDLDKLKKIE